MTIDPNEKSDDHEISSNNTDKSELTEIHPVEIIDNEFTMSINTINVLEPISKQYLGVVTEYQNIGNSYIFNDGRASVEVKVISDAIIRVRLAPHSSFLDEFSYAIQPYDHKITRIDFSQDETFYKVSTNTVTCSIRKENFFVSFSDFEEKVIIEDDKPMHWEENAHFGGYYVYCSKKSQPEEQYYGLGDKPTESNIKGKRFTMWGTDTYAFEKDCDPLYRNIPFYIGLNHNTSYGIFFDNSFKSYFDFAFEKPDRTSFWADGGEMNYYYIHGPHMMDVVKRYATLTGTHAMPPMWALGYHQCRWSYYPEKKVKDLAANFRNKQIPCDALYLDIDYMDGYRCFTWDKKYFPDPRRMMKELSNDGFKTVVIIDPGIKVDDNYWVFKEGKENKYFCRRCDDYFMEGHVWPGRCQFPDFTNPEVRNWWGTLFKEFVDMGVAGVWNDMNEPAVFGSGTFPDDVRHNYDGFRGSHRKAHNVYGMQMVRASYEGLKKLQKNKRPFTITRSGYSGVQRYSSVWTGDNVATWEHLKLANTMCQRLSISGISFCGSDIGGFTGEPDGELFTRWVQLGVFAPLMRAHSAGDTPEREPWSFGPEYEAICKKFIELRYKLIPYIYSAFWEHHKYGFPMLRPMVMVEQDNSLNHFREDEFTFGDKILVCPVCEQGATSRNVYLPNGSWYHYWDNQLVIGGSVHHVEAGIDSMPLFVRAGSVIPEYPIMQYVGEKEIDEMLLNIYYADYEVNSFFFEDHGDTFGYEQDIYTEKKYIVNGNKSTLTIEQFIEGLFTPRYEYYELRIIGLPFKIHKIVIDGKEQKDFEKANETTIKIKAFKNFKTIHIS